MKPARLLSALCFAGLSIVAAEAAAFEPIDCSGFVFVPTDIGTSQMELEAADTSRYADNSHYFWRLVHNARVSRIWLRNKDMNLEPDYDFMYFGNHTYGFPTDAGLNGFHITGARADGSWNSLESDDEGVDLGWKTDVSVGLSQRPRFDEVAVLCGRGGTDWVYMPGGLNRQFDGILLGSSDVVKLLVWQPANTHVTISLDQITGETDTGQTADYDLYVDPDDGSVFDENNWTWRGFHGANADDTGGEFLDIGTAPIARWLRIAVKSYRGKGQFALRVNAMKPATHTDDDTMTVCTTRNNLSALGNWDDYVETLRRTALRVHAMTSGGRWPNRWQHQQIAGCNDDWCTNQSLAGCDVLMTPTTGGDSCGMQAWNGRFRIPDIACGNYGNPSGLALILAHEFGHTLGLPDEYEGIGPWANGDRGAYCGHSIMNGPSWHNHSLCTKNNHCSEPTWSTASNRFYSGGANCDSEDSGWSRLWQTGDYYYVPYSNRSADPWDTAHNNAWSRAAIVVTP